MSLTSVSRHGVTMRGPGRWRAGPLAGVLVGLALFAGACGSKGSGTGVASVGTGSATPTQTGQSGSFDPVKHAQCMRSHGVPNFPDPIAQEDGGSIIDLNGLGIDPESAKFKAAQDACKEFAPQGSGPGPGGPGLPADMKKQLLAYAKCMRSEGIKDFPDPGDDGGLRLPDGLDPNQPRFKAAEKACEDQMPKGPNGELPRKKNGGPGPGPGSNG